MASSTARQPQSNASRKILDAAATLFVSRGYAATTVEMMANEAGVAVPTVYFSYRSKINVLRALFERDISADAVSMAGHRDLVEVALAETDPAEQIRLHVRAHGVRNARAGSLSAMLHRAVDVDAEADELWRADLDQRRAVQRKLLGALRSHGGLAVGVRPQRAIDILSAFLGPDLYCTLVVDRGWSSVEWERWTTVMLQQQLLAPTAVAT